MSKFTTRIIQLIVIITALQIAATAQLPQYYAWNRIKMAMFGWVLMKGYTATTPKQIMRFDDNGIGRRQASAIDAGNLSSFVYQSKSTALIMERLQLLRQKTGKKASITIDDKMKNGEHAGTRVQIIIPYYNNDEI